MPSRGAARKIEARDKWNANQGEVASRGPDDFAQWLEPGKDPQNRLISPFMKHLAEDQQSFWLSPSHAEPRDLKWALPLAAFGSAVIASDSWISKQVPSSPLGIKHGQDISNYGVFSLIGLGGGAFLLGHLDTDDHLQEAGILSGEAAINSTAVAYFLKEITQRVRPDEGNQHGAFFRGGDSFPSEHAAAAWSIASVLAHEYPGPLSQTLAYGLASAVSMGRITGKDHFASDMLVGGALGWYFARRVYRAHHDPEVGGGAWGSWWSERRAEKMPNPANLGSRAVPTDSWVYSAFDRLAALGYTHEGYEGMRPWTRLECARHLEAIGDKLPADADDEEAARLFARLSSEFRHETAELDGGPNLGISVDSIYTRTSAIAGPPLTDGFDFAQTLFNDYGRPYGRGFNNITGMTAHAEAGSLAFFVQGEYQSAPAVASEPSSALQAIAAAEDGTPAEPNGRAAISRFRLLDAYVSWTFHGFRVSFGQQSLWLGPSPGGPFLLSDNASPVRMLRVEQGPIHVPGLSHLLGPMRTEFLIGRLSGTQWVYANNILFGPHIADQPFLHLEKVSFKPTANFEFGMGISVIFGGPGLPVTWSDFFRTFNLSGQSTALPGTAADPGDRRSAAEFTYRLPHLRDWATFYGDSFVDDEATPIGSSRPCLREGLYFPKLPRVSKLDLRLEAVYTDPPNGEAPGNIYDNGRFRSGYTNNGLLMGSWVGRDGKGGQAWATYWFSPRSTLQFFYRRQQVSAKFLEGGGLNDFGAKAEVPLGTDLSLQAFAQYERWRFPLLAAGTNSNLALSLGLTFRPKWGVAH